MNLFDLTVNDVDLHPNFKHILPPSREAERKELMRWAEGFPDRDGKVVKELQTTFNSTFWEIYLHAVFNEYGLQENWAHPSPDFLIHAKQSSFIVEATTANNAQGKPGEWEKDIGFKQLEELTLTEINRESTLRLANSFISKWRKYKESYSTLDHVKQKPFVLALAPFEQPNFNLQYNRPIMSLLYDYYVDEDTYLDNPHAFPNGPPVVELGFVEKDNGAEIPLGFFNDDSYSEISAVIFSSTATWGKISAMAENSNLKFIYSLWGTEPYGISELFTNKQRSECLTDGLQIYHNPYAKHPLSVDIFKRKGVVQCVPNLTTNTLDMEEINSSLHSRIAFMPTTKDES